MRYKRLRALGMEEEQVHRHANNRYGVWFCSGLQYFNSALDNTKLRELGNILPLVPLNVIVLYIISEQILKPSQKQMTFSNFFGIITY